MLSVMAHTEPWEGEVWMQTSLQPALTFPLVPDTCTALSCARSAGAIPTRSKYCCILLYSETIRSSPRRRICSRTAAFVCNPFSVEIATCAHSFTAGHSHHGGYPVILIDFARSWVHTLQTGGQSSLLRMLKPSLKPCARRP